jgi:hypothetical protein
MHRRVVIGRFCKLLGLLAVCGPLLPGCGDDMSQPKTIIPEEAPKEKGKDSQEFFTKQYLQKKGTKAKTK